MKKKLDWKIWLLIIVVLGSLLALFPLSYTRGVVIVSVEQNSSAFREGLRQGMIITGVDEQLIEDFEDYKQALSEFPIDKERKLIITTDKGEFVLFTKEPPNLSVKNIDNTRIKTGLDLSGGARALVQAERPISAMELNDLIAVTSERLNVYGLKDVVIRPVSDLSGNNFMLIEIAGSTPKELENLIAKQGHFEARIGNETVFVGGNKDITYVARTGQEAGIFSCNAYSQGGEICQFRFAISLSEEAAERHAEITGKLGINASNPEYLDKQLDLFLDDKLTDSLFIGKDLKGSATTQIAISGSGVGSTRQEAYDNSLANMKQLQTVLITGSLPFKLQIVKLDTISPLLGKQFLNTIILAGIAAIVAVGVMTFIRYRKIKFSLAVLLTSLCEVIIILGVSALFNRNLDLPAIAGIIAAIGTGVDSQIIILDESQMSKSFSLKERIKRALYIIIGTYVTTLFALMPLMWAGAGLLKGFAITTIIGISTGVFITRPAFSEIVKRILKE
jgi:preprotein translocase subunit SecD